MEIIFFIPGLLIFLFTLYKLSVDDHVLIRKNISLEQMFDIAFNTLWISIVVSRICYFLFVPGNYGNLFIAFFSTVGGFSLTGAVIGGLTALYIFATMKKFPLGRIFDFISIALLFALPVGYIGLAFFHQKTMIAFLICGVIYLLLAILFRKLLYPRLLNKTLKEGTIGLLFLLSFTILSFTVSFFGAKNTAINLYSLENIVLYILLAGSIVLLIKQERTKLRRRS